jgi:bifunctional non-homologous end joining protein LigD
MAQARAARGARGHDIATYRARRDFSVTSEPPPKDAHRSAGGIFVVQKHAARRLHWDLRLEHDGVLWSWAVPKGPSLDPGDKRLAVHVEDHPLDYADFEGRIPAGQYGAGTVEIWDRGTWQPMGDPAEGMRDGELKFRLDGQRLHGGFVLVRLKPRAGERAESWLLIKEHDAAEHPGADAAALEVATPDPSKRTRRKTAATKPPAPRAVRAEMPATQAPQLATQVAHPPAGTNWLGEVKFDGYRLLAFVDGGGTRLITRNGHDWTARLSRVAALFDAFAGQRAILDGELVALRADGVSSFGDLQEALKHGRDGSLVFYAFDLLYLDGWDLRPCRLDARKALLRGLIKWRGNLRYSDHHEGQTDALQREACAMGLEGIVCKRADAPYENRRTSTWVKVKCEEREEFIVLGYTPPGGTRQGIGSLQVGYRDPEGRLQYAGGVGTGFSDDELAALRRRLEALKAPAPEGLLYGGDEKPDAHVIWVRPELVAEIRFIGWTNAGRIRHSVFLGLREDKPAAEVVRPIVAPEAPRTPVRGAPRPRIVRASAPAKERAAMARPTIVRAKSAARETLAGISLSHPDKELWPGITKRDLADYWLAISGHALPGIAHRPLALVRCPDGIAGQHFFQKHAHTSFPAAIREGSADGAPYLVLDDGAGLVAAAQAAAIELHAWGATEADPLHADRLVFDLDPGEGVAWAEVVAAAQDVRNRLARFGLAAFPRTTGGKGLHIVVPVAPHADWPAVREWCHRFATRMEADARDRYIASVPKAKRVGRILVDWLRNGLGSTAVASFSPRARPGATVATPIDWRELRTLTDPAVFNLRTVPDRLGRQKRDKWEGFAEAAKPLPTELP